MSLQTPPAASTHSVNPAAKAPARQPNGSGHGHANGGVSPFAQLLQGLDDATPDASGLPTSSEEASADDEPDERTTGPKEKAAKAKDPAEDANATPQQPAQPAETAEADQRATLLGRANLLAVARARAGAEARGRAASLAESDGTERASGTGHLTGKELLQAASDAGNNGLDISAFKPALDAATVNLAPAVPSVAGAPADFSLPSLGAAGSAPAAAPEAVPAQATLTPPPGSAAFPAALGAQLNTWLKDGVQYASLELNPQDMGPIDVRIALRDGRTQVELGADVAATREALADALPALAEALGDVGLSLSGGSVSDQTGQHARQGDAEAQRGFSLPGWLAPGREGEAAQTAAPQRAQRGLVDLVA